MKTKNKSGFTLIELLAVIVVLAIIALIATPIVMKTIKNAKKGAAERSADSYIKQVETAVATERLEGNVLEGEYTIQSDGDICPVAGCGDNNKDKVKIEVSGNKPKSGKVTITNGQVTITSKLDMGDYDVTYDSENKKYTASEKGSTPDAPTAKTYANGEVVYFNVTTGTKCSDYTETQSDTGVKDGCMKFYAFNDNGEDTVTLLLDHNTTRGVAWNTESNGSGPKEILEQLKTDTEAWLGTETPLNYTMDQTGQASNMKYTIDYSDYKARLMTAQEIATITGNTTWNEQTAVDIFYFDTNTSSASDTCKYGSTSGCQYGWLYDRTSTDCTKYGCLNSATAYEFWWTASSFAGDNYSVWMMNSNGSVGKSSSGNSGSFALRPVITVLKSKLG